MRILINASNLKLGGGIQVADSICNQLYRFGIHRFTVVLSSFLDSTAKRIDGVKNVEVIRYDIKNSLSTLIRGRDKFLDSLVEKKQIDCVLTVFGPSRWNPKVPHVSGFAMSHLVLQNSPYFTKQIHGLTKLKTWIRFKIINQAFRRSTKYFFTENEYISKLLRDKWPGYHISTITNYYNQIFNQPKKWEMFELPHFEGTTLLTISANYPHKNLEIGIDIAKKLRLKYPEFKFRFVYTIAPESINIPEELNEVFILIGKVDISQCPNLYQQADIAFQPTLLECFTATYPEAMKMKVPIITTDLEFARGLCGDAAIFYSPLNAEEAADRIYEVSNDEKLRDMLISEGQNRLKSFDTFEQRAEKIISLCEKIIENKI